MEWNGIQVATWSALLVMCVPSYMCGGPVGGTVSFMVAVMGRMVRKASHLPLGKEQRLGTQKSGSD